MKIKIHNFLHIFESCWLCLRFPFLFPRDRFTDRHKTNLLHSLLTKLKKQSTQDISIRGILEKDTQDRYASSIRFLNNVVKFDKESNKLFINNEIDTQVVSLNNVIWSDKFEVLGISLVWAVIGNPVILIHVRVKDSSDNTNYGFISKLVTLITNKFKYKLYKIVQWIDSEVLDRFCFIPTFTELDAMPSGWRKAFGIQLCKDIRRQLIKEHNLFSYRIYQIKEKFGILCWYDNGSRKVLNIISKYEELSWNTCIICGNPSTKISSIWICPYCEEHYPKDQIVYQEKIDANWELANEYKEHIQDLYAKDKKEI